jgi:hypothetical protein
MPKRNAPGHRAGNVEHHPDLPHDQVAAACDYLEHVTEHNGDAITRYRSGQMDIYVVADPVWRDKFREFTRAEFPGSQRR